MSARERFPQPKLPRSHYFFSLARGESMRTFAVRPWALWSLIAIAPLSLVWGAGAAAYIAFHDDMLRAFATRQAEMQYAYEDRLAEARSELDRVASRQLLDQTSFEGKVHELLSRQARLEQRSSVVAALAGQAAREASLLDRPRAAAVRTPASALGAIQAASPLGADSVDDGPARAFAPNGAISLMPRSAKPRPVEEPRPDKVSALPPGAEPAASSEIAAAAGNPDLDANARLGIIDYSLDRMEHKQIATLTDIGAAAERTAARLGAVVAQTGLSADKLTAPRVEGGVGGPFIPAPVDSKAPAFDKAAARVAMEVAVAERLQALMPFVPVRRPLIGEASVTSPFGYRPDPFLGRPALHPGVDLVQSYGAEIHCTGAGKVTHAGWMGGYGQMVEIDHGNGLVTRYGHMSEVLVDDGQEVRQGALIGRIGSTGRSTGPHLHYEVRVDGDPVDPERFLRAGALLTAG